MEQQRAQRRKYHYIYKTTCSITNRFYVGMHSTNNLEDRLSRKWKNTKKFFKQIWKRKP